MGGTLDAKDVEGTDANPMHNPNGPKLTTEQRVELTRLLADVDRHHKEEIDALIALRSSAEALGAQRLVKEVEGTIKRKEEVHREEFTAIGVRFRELHEAKMSSDDDLSDLELVNAEGGSFTRIEPWTNENVKKFLQECEGKGIPTFRTGLFGMRFRDDVILAVCRFSLGRVESRRFTNAPETVFKELETRPRGTTSAEVVRRAVGGS